MKSIEVTIFFNIQDHVYLFHFFKKRFSEKSKKCHKKRFWREIRKDIHSKFLFLCASRTNQCTLHRFLSTITINIIQKPYCGVCIQYVEGGGGGGTTGDVWKSFFFISKNHWKSWNIENIGNHKKSWNLENHQKSRKNLKILKM